MLLPVPRMKTWLYHCRSTGCAGSGHLGPGPSPVCPNLLPQELRHLPLRLRCFQHSLLAVPVGNPWRAITLWVRMLGEPSVERGEVPTGTKAFRKGNHWCSLVHTPHLLVKRQHCTVEGRRAWAGAEVQVHTCPGSA